MFLRPTYIRKNGQTYAYWKLVESYRTERGPRQRTVAHLGRMDEAGRLGLVQSIHPPSDTVQGSLFPEPSTEPRFVEIDRHSVRVENGRQFGGPWLALELIRKLGLVDFLKGVMPPGREQIPWSVSSLILIISRFCKPSSELHIAEHFFRNSSLSELLGVSDDKVDDNRLYRALDALLPHKEALEVYLKKRFGELFGIEYDLLLYDVTSTYFEGQAVRNPLAKRGYSRDHRPDCKQVCIGLVVTRCGLPLGYEIFAGNRHDSTTVKEIVNLMENRYGKAQRIWVMDRGMVSEDNLDFMKEGGRQYIIGTPKSQLKRFEEQLLAPDWRTIHDGLEVKLCPCPAGGKETFILCRSRDRRLKEQAMHQRFEKRIEEGLTQLGESCGKRKQDPIKVSQRVGKILGQNSRAAGLFDVQVTQNAEGAAQITWNKVEKWRSWSEISEGAYLLRSNVLHWTDEELWKAYIQLTEAEEAFRIQKSDLSLRPVWHQKEDRVGAHILVCFLSYVLWKFLGQLCSRADLGNCPRRIVDELNQIQAVDVVLKTRDGKEIRTRCVTQPSGHQQILLRQLGLEMPKNLRLFQM